LNKESPTRPQKRPTYSQKSPAYSQKSPTYSQKSPTYSQKSHTYSQQSRIYPYLSSTHPQKGLKIHMNIYVGIGLYLRHFCACTFKFEADIFTKEPDIPIFDARQKSPAYSQKSHTYSQKSPTCPYLSPTHPQNGLHRLCLGIRVYLRPFSLHVYSDSRPTHPQKMYDVIICIFTHFIIRIQKRAYSYMYEGLYLRYCCGCIFRFERDISTKEP